MTSASLLIELGTEELPPKALKKLSEAFTKEIAEGLLEAKLVSAGAEVSPYATPRRLAIVVGNVLEQQPSQQVDRRGPAVQAAFKDGEPTPAAIGFAKSCGVEVADLSRLKTEKGEWLSYSVSEEGKAVAQVVQSVLDTAIKRLPIPKRMRWGDKEEEFVRPAKWLTVMHGSEILPIECLGLTAANTSRGHRFHSTALIEHKNAADYETMLTEFGHVIPSFQQRQEMISEQMAALLKSVNAVMDQDPDLLDEVTGLVEYPRAVLGNFDPDFLEVPQECLISSMRDHQKYFHLRDEQGSLLPKFITVSNITSKDETRMIDGNERVLRARLADAEFFWKSDQKTKLADRLPSLGNVLFHAKLGTVLEKAHRVQALTKKICDNLGGQSQHAERAALLAKADLVSDMVGEFDELQGVMGHYYADIDGEDSLVGDCIEQHYWPKFAGDKLPASVEATSLALADKLDSLVGIYSAGEVPTGDKDPYALRRAALGILRILIEGQHSFRVSELVEWAASTLEEHNKLVIDDDTRRNIKDFVIGRLLSYYQAQGIATSTINAVMACEPDSPLDFELRLKAVDEFSRLTESIDLAAANKRIGNILKKQAGVTADVNPALFVETAEKSLYKAIQDLEKDCINLFENGQYSVGLAKLAALRTPVDEFFDGVMVMSDDQATQDNRLALLKSLQDLFLRVADISLLQN
ncbi:MAG: glycine--tRNA ligase subunit beta [Pseudomonadota bacterium]